MLKVLKVLRMKTRNETAHDISEKGLGAWTLFVPTISEGHVRNRTPDKSELH